MAARVSSRYEMGQTTRSEWEKDMKEHRELLRNVIEEHREGRDGGVMDWSDIAAELAFEEEKVYPPVHMLASSNPPSVVKGKSGWIYHSTSLGCLRPYHLPRRLAINVVESAVFDPFILLTIMANCTTMAWASPMDPPDTPKQDFLAVCCCPLMPRLPLRGGSSPAARRRRAARPLLSPPGRGALVIREVAAPLAACGVPGLDQCSF